jgi:hypothetical protein
MISESLLMPANPAAIMISRPPDIQVESKEFRWGRASWFTSARRWFAMPKAYSLDLRESVARFVNSSRSRHAAAAHFKVSVSFGESDEGLSHDRKSGT